jgi:alpha-L-arabinofuranosidase
LTSGEILTANGAKAANSFDEPNAVAACAFDAVTIRDNELVTELPPLSLVALSFAVS